MSTISMPRRIASPNSYACRAAFSERYGAPNFPAHLGHILHCVDATAHRVQGVERAASQTTEHQGTSCPADDEPTVRQRHEHAVRADKAGRLIQAGRDVIGAATDVHLVVDVRASPRRGAVGDKGEALAAPLVDIEE
ncbi:MAG: hypothetical protein NXH94_06965 [Rhodobacteraceae bacterium]|nr:hypothetical protein [Paracoccaceae bacterium]